MTGGGSSDKKDEKTGKGTKDDQSSFKEIRWKSYSSNSKKKDDGNYSVSTQTGADQRPKAPLDTNPYFDNPGLKVIGMSEQNMLSRGR